MADFAIRFNDWSGGDWGNTQADKVKANQFSGVNMVPYPSGMLGVRPGLKWMDPTAHVYNPPANPMPNIRGFDVVNDRILIGCADNTYEFYWAAPPGGIPANAPAANPVGLSTTAPMQFLYGSDSTSTAATPGNDYMLCDGRLFIKVPKFNFPLWYEITLPAPLSMIARWGLFLVGVDRNIPSRLWFSRVDASGASFATWPANNFLDVGTTEPINCLLPIYNVLYAGKASGWSGISGVLGTQATVRELAWGNGPAGPQRFAAVTTDNRIAYWPAAQKVPAMWNGERVQLIDDHRMEQLRLDGFMGQAVITTATERRVLFASSNTSAPNGSFWWLKDGAWTHHNPRPAQTMGAWAPSDVRTAYQVPEHVLFGAMAATVNGEWQVFSMQHDLDRPASDNDTYCSPFDQSAFSPDLVSGSVLFPGWFDSQGRQVRVRSVIVQFRKWQSMPAFPANTSILQCRVDALGEYGGGVIPGAVQQWSEANGVADVTGTDDSVRFNFGEQGFGNGFQVALPLVRNLAIREVVALVDVRTART